MITWTLLSSPPRKQKLLIIALMLAVGLSSSWLPEAAAAPVDPAKVPVSRESIPSEKELVHRSDLVLYGDIGETAAPHPTGQHEGSLRVVHYIQNIRVKRVWKGQASGAIKLLTSGVEPLPDAIDPLNKTYTGPLEAGEYICFLRRAPNSDYYTLTGIWKGLYPVYDGKSIALLDNGAFRSFDKLTLSQFESKVKALQAP